MSHWLRSAVARPLQWGCRSAINWSGNNRVASPWPLQNAIKANGASREFKRSYATAGGASDSNTNGRVLSTTKEWSPGHSVATVSLSNPTKLNIVNTALLEQWVRTFDALKQDENLRAVVLTGAPVAGKLAPSFIGGADITEMNKISSSEEAHAFITRVHAACQALRDCPVPVIARVHGFALGAGLEILASCDLRIATKGSVFGMPEVKVGIPSVIEAAYLPGLIGMGRTRRFLYLAENITAHEAESWGLIEKVVDDEAALDRRVDDWVDKIVSMGPKAIRSQKILMQKWENCTVDEGIRAGMDAYAESYADGGVEPKEFMGKFVNRKR